MSLDLDTTLGLLLDVLHICATVANNLGTQVEAGDGFEVDRDLVVWPFFLFELVEKSMKATYVYVPGRIRPAQRAADLLSLCAGNVFRQLVAEARSGSGR